jgi:hypothetical protein
MSLRDHSQHGEDALLWAVFRGRSSGSFVEAGAFDGRYLSNSLSFEERGWKGVCVQAHPTYAPLCRANATARRVTTMSVLGRN